MHIVPEQCAYQASVMRYIVWIDNAAFAEGFLQRGMFLDHSYVQQAIEVHATSRLFLFLQYE
ncbi:hypothetical protein SEUCBS139899_008501 [Sporothrix eucalyptigena]